ncbi:MAG: hypothetical protein ACFUZC_20565 [Chthoniobacteraceae bacterium]
MHTLPPGCEPENHRHALHWLATPLSFVAVVAFGLGFIVLRAAYPGGESHGRTCNRLMSAGTPQIIAEKVAASHSIADSDLAVLSAGPATAVNEHIWEHRRRVAIGATLIGSSLALGTAGLSFSNKKVTLRSTACGASPDPNRRPS